ncbi:MAG: sporulation transcriptional regulator SpoIIID [Bacilli bacterium]|nr:sporulation transcriptional regulator SpoIIID [Bacilli bacterium]
MINEANYIIKNNATIRETAKAFNLGKSTIHNDVTKRLKIIDKELHKKIRKVMLNHLATRHILGGEKTKILYKK